jgi:hypothetical protein
MGEGLGLQTGGSLEWIIAWPVARPFTRPYKQRPGSTSKSGFPTFQKVRQMGTGKGAKKRVSLERIGVHQKSLEETKNGVSLHLNNAKDRPSYDRWGDC